MCDFGKCLKCTNYVLPFCASICHMASLHFNTFISMDRSPLHTAPVQINNGTIYSGQEAHYRTHFRQLGRIQASYPLTPSTTASWAVCLRPPAMHSRGRNRSRPRALTTTPPLRQRHTIVIGS